VNGSWVGATPTPGLANQASVSTSDNSNTTPVSSNNSNNTSVSGGGSYSSSTSTTSKNKTTAVSKIKTEITMKTLGFVGIPLSVQAKTFGTSGEQLYSGEYFWNFGDGDSKEENLVGSQPFYHTYFYPGDYVVSLDYFKNYFPNISVPDDSIQINIKIITPDIFISRVGDEKDFFVELTNNTNYSADLSGWILVSDYRKFTIPRNTNIAPKQKMMISPKITNFSIIDKYTLKLLIPQGYMVDNATDVGRLESSSEKNPYTTPPNPPLNQGRAQTASVGDNMISEITPAKGGSERGSFSFLITFIISIIFIGASACAVYFIRRKKIVPQEGDDFKILDE
jgi:hypothetical protein